MDEWMGAVDILKTGRGVNMETSSLTVTVPPVSETTETSFPRRADLNDSTGAVDALCWGHSLAYYSLSIYIYSL